MHKHRPWKYLERGHGIPPKQNVPDPEVIEGFKAQCECGKILFYPDNPHLKPVELMDET